MYISYLKKEDGTNIACLGRHFGDSRRTEEHDDNVCQSWAESRDIKIGDLQENEKVMYILIWERKSTLTLCCRLLVYRLQKNRRTWARTRTGSFWVDSWNIEVGDVYERKPAAIFIPFEPEKVAQTCDQPWFVLVTEKTEEVHMMG